MKNLSKANKLLKDIAKKDKKITPITQKDISLFQKFFKKEPHTYGNSWTYVVQGKYGIGPKGLGYKYYDGKNLSSFSIYPHMERPDTPCIYWTRPMGLDILDIISKYAHEFLILYKTPTFVKKIFSDQFENLQKKGFKDTSKFPWHRNYPLEDDTYPEIIIDVKATVENTKHSEKIRNSLKRFRGLAKIVSIKNVVNDNQRQIGWKVANEFFQQQLFALTENISRAEDYYNILFESNYSKHELFLIFQDSIPRGVFDLNQLDDTYYSIYMSLMLREELRNLNEFSVIYRCQRILERGGSYLNMGGSETEGLHKFKNKFAVAKINKMTWATFY